MVWHANKNIYQTDKILQGYTQEKAILLFSLFRQSRVEVCIINETCPSRYIKMGEVVGGGGGGVTSAEGWGWGSQRQV